MATLERLPSRMRIVMLDACRNNPFPATDDAGRGLAIVDAPNGSIVGYSTAPGSEALDGNNGHSPYTNAFLNLARQPNVPIEQLFKRVRLEVNHTTSGQQTPWESSSLTSDFTFLGDTAVAAIRAPANEPVVQMASNLPSRAARQAYDFVVSEGKASYYQEFLDRYPQDPLCDKIRLLLANLLEAAAWHTAVLSNSPLAYKAFYEKHPTSPYAIPAIKLASQPKIVPLLPATHLLINKNPVVTAIKPGGEKGFGDLKPTLLGLSAAAGFARKEIQRLRSFAMRKGKRHDELKKATSVLGRLYRVTSLSIVATDLVRPRDSPRWSSALSREWQASGGSPSSTTSGSCAGCPPAKR